MPDTRDDLVPRLLDHFDNAVSNVYWIASNWDCTQEDRARTQADIDDIERIRDETITALDSRWREHWISCDAHGWVKFPHVD